MKKVKSFDDYLTNLILEKVENGELQFIISDRLENLLKVIKHPITSDLLNMSRLGRPAEYTLIDYDDELENMFTYSTSIKLLNYIDPENDKGSDKNFDNLYRLSKLQKGNKIWDVNKSKIRIGTLIKKIFKDKYDPNGNPGDDIESFVELIKSERTKMKGNFRIVEGQDIIKYYNENSYESSGWGSVLNGSCMRYDDCAPYLEFYSINDVKLVLLMSDDHKDRIKGRALLWNVGKLNGVDVSDRKFLDKIYTIRSQDVDKFKQLSIKNNWIFKSDQTSYSKTLLIDPTSDKLIDSIVVFNVKESTSYPYTDTLKFFNTSENYLTNEDYDDWDYKLESTTGGYFDDFGREYAYIDSVGEIMNADELYWSDAEEKFIVKSEAIYSNIDALYMSQEYADNNYTRSDIMEDWIPNEYLVYVESIDDYVTDNYLKSEFLKSSYDNKFYLDSDSYESTKWDVVPKKYAVYVFITDKLYKDDFYDISLIHYNNEKADIRWIDDNTYDSVYIKEMKNHFNFDKSFKGEPNLKL